VYKRCTSFIKSVKNLCPTQKKITIIYFTATERPKLTNLTLLGESDSINAGLRFQNFYGHFGYACRERNITRFFLYKQQVYKHTQPQILEILSTLLSTPPASDFENDNKISEKLQFFFQNFKTIT